MTTSAQYSIDYQLLEPPHLSPGKRQRQIKGTLLILHQGAGLLQLGPHYYALGQDEAVFLPADTLFTWHSLAHSRVSRFTFSPRLPQPTQAGVLRQAPLLLAGAARLADWPNAPDWHGAYGRLCRALHDELQLHQPQPLGSQPGLQQRISANLVNFSLNAAQTAEFVTRFNTQPEHFQRQCALLLVLRDLAKSPNLVQLVQQHGFASVAEFEQDCRHWLGNGDDTPAKNG